MTEQPGTLVQPPVDPPKPALRDPRKWGYFDGGNVQAEWLTRESRPVKQWVLILVVAFLFVVAMATNWLVLRWGTNDVVRLVVVTAVVGSLLAIVLNLRTDRRMMLLRSIAYVDPDGVRWEVPAGHVIDGASIPRLFWWPIGGPFDGYFRMASVHHDRYCDIKSKPSWDVHRMFYRAMRCEGCARWRATTMWLGVVIGGPRFKGEPK